MAENAVEVTSGSKAAVNTKCARMLKGLEILLLSIVVAFFCGLYALPTVFYALPPIQVVGSVQDENTETNSSCSPQVIYQGEACKNELKEWQECFSGPQTVSTNESIYVASNIDQEEMEEMASLFLRTGLPILRPSQECEAAIRPFLCLYLFGSCDTSNQFHHTSIRDCVRIRDEVCRQEWQQAVGFLGEGVLPTCEQLSNQAEDCINANETELNSTSTSTSSTLSPVGNNVIVCSEGFYLKENLCRPECGRWTSPGYIDNPAFETSMVILSAAIALLSAIVFNIIAATLQRKTIWTFPSIYLVYVTMTTSVVALIFLIGTTSQTTLFCSSRDLLETFEKPSPFCTFTGIAYYYGLLQIAMWLLFHSGALFWGIVFPFHYRRWKNEGRFKFIHITTVTLALLVPTIPAFVNLRFGYAVFSSPTFACQGTNANSTYATLILPFSIIWAISSSMLVITFWTIFKQMINKARVSKKRMDIKRYGKAEIKILFILCYYTLVGVLFLIFLSIVQVTREVNQTALQDYFLCESTKNRDSECDSLATVEVTVNVRFGILVYILEGLVPLVILIFGVNIDLKAIKKCMRCKRDPNPLQLQSQFSKLFVINGMSPPSTPGSPSSPGSPESQSQEIFSAMEKL